MNVDLVKKKLVFGCTAVVIGLSSAAYADTVRVVTNLKVEGQPLQMEKEIGFTPQGKEIVVHVAGKKCVFGSSRLGSAPRGCNYTITIDGKSVTPSAREVDPPCKQIPMSCK